MDILRLLVFFLGLAIVARTVFSAIQTFVLPRSANDRLSRLVFRSIFGVFRLLLRKTHTFEQRDRIMAFFAPISLLTLLPVYLMLLFIGFAGMYWAIGQVGSFEQALRVSGSSLLTLGYAAPGDLPDGFLMFAEATIGLILLAVLIAYLPMMYGAFQRREQAVTMLEVRAGSPPSAVEMILRYHRIHGLDSTQRAVGAVGTMVRRHRREPYLAGRAGVLSLAAARSFVGHRRGCGAGCGRAAPIDRRCAA